LKGGASIKLEGEGLKLEGCFFHHVCSRHLIVKTSKISVLSDKRVVQLLGQGLAMALTFAHSMPITENAVAGGSSGVAGRVAGGSGACAPGESLANDQKAVMRAAAGLTELRAGAQGMRAEGWVPCTQRWSGWDGIKLINRSNRLILEKDSLTLSMRPAETGRVTAMALSADALLLAAVCQGGALSVWDTSTKQIVKQFTEHKGGNNKYEFLSVAFTHHGARVVVGGAVRQRHKLVPGVDENVQKLVGGFIREFDICSNPAISSSGASCSIIQTVAVSTGCITSMLPAWSLASPTKLPATSHAAAQQADASQGDGSGVVLARCVEEGKIYCFQFDPAAGKLVLAASIQVSGAGSLAVVYPRAVGQSLPSADCSATEATQGVTETAQPDCVHAIKPDRMQADLKVGSVAEDSRPHVLVACSERGLAFFDLASHGLCSVLQCVAVYCSVLQRVAVCYSVLQRVATCCSMRQLVAVVYAVCDLVSHGLFSVLQRVTACCSVLQRVAACCNMRQLVAVCDLVSHRLFSSLVCLLPFTTTRLPSALCCVVHSRMLLST